MLIDDVTITIKAGNGGNGKLSFLRNSHQPKGGPDGGDGGMGGNVVFQGTSDLTALSQFQYKKKLFAESGGNGGNQNKHGANGKDLIVLVPVGTTITDVTYGLTHEITDVNTPVVVAAGARGGHGNAYYKGPTNQSPIRVEKGRETPLKEIHLELSFIADVGLIGLPNAGKSSLLEALTAATPKIGNYPFTTLEPNLGVMNRYILADIPGLIEGASNGKGLGIKFLKHIEKTRILVHCIDITSVDPYHDYETIRNELREYDKELLKKKELILLTKFDLVADSVRDEKLAVFKSKKKRVMAMSAIDDKSLTLLQTALIKLLK